MWDEYDDSINGQFTRVILTSVDDSGPQQLVRVAGIDGQDIGESVRLQHFGESSVPPQGAEGLALLSGGRFDRIHILGLEHPDKRPKSLPAGAKALYDASGNIIKLFGSQGVTFDFSNTGWTLKCKGATVSSTGEDLYLAVTNAKLYLGGQKGDSFSPVETVAGPSSIVFAKV